MSEVQLFSLPHQVTEGNRTSVDLVHSEVPKASTGRPQGLHRELHPDLRITDAAHCFCDMEA